MAIDNTNINILKQKYYRKQQTLMVSHQICITMPMGTTSGAGTAYRAVSTAL